MQKIEFKDYPDTSTLINAENLKTIQDNVEISINEVDTNNTNLINEVDTKNTNLKNQVVNGWYEIDSNAVPTFTYVSWDSSVYTGVVNSNLDLTPYLSVGMKVKFTQNSVINYAFITAITSTQLTLFLGTDYSLNNSAISNTYFSMLKAPYGFPLDPDKWTVYEELQTSFNQNNPTNGTWYNVMSISIPIGNFICEYQTIGYSSRANAGNCNFLNTLSTTNNSESDRHNTSCNEAAGITAMGYISNKKTNININNSVKTTYYLNIKTTQNGITLLAVNNAVRETIYIRATCAYL